MRFVGAIRLDLPLWRCRQSAASMVRSLLRIEAMAGLYGQTRLNSYGTGH
jgi:hypothetical protein